MSRYIDFVVVDEKPKTKVWGLFAKKDYDVIGQIRWYPPWRQYCLFPSDDVVFSAGCLSDIVEFIAKANREHRTGGVCESTVPLT